MNDTSPSTPHPAGPAWAWYLAWSLQGAAAAALELAGPTQGPIRFALLGLLTGLPLLVLYLWLRRRA